MYSSMKRKCLQGCFFQDAMMKYSFECYPEVVLFDATYKLNELRMPLYLMLVIDGNGQSEIVSLFLTSLEMKAAITDMIKAFKSANSSWSNVGVIITDKDFTERAVFNEEFPNSSLHICLFHALRSFRREITCDKLGIRPGERDHCLELITKLSYSRSEEEYDEHYSTLLDSAPKPVINYYNANWHDIRYEWVECFKSACITLGERTNNRLECINGKVKSVCSKFSSLQQFFDQFFAMLSVLRNERDHNTIMALTKKPVIYDSEHKEFVSLLTPYALQFIVKQLALRKKVKILNNQDGVCEVSSSEGYILHTYLYICIIVNFAFTCIGTLSVSCDSCHCLFASSMQLPCRHMFAVRDSQQKPIYSEVGVGNRWRMSYLKQVFGEKNATVEDCSYEVCT